MNEIYRYRDVILLSDKTLEKIDNEKVWFTDGSLADLANLTFSSKGPGDIRFEVISRERPDEKRETRIYPFPYGTLIDLEGGDLYFEVRETTEPECSVEVIGTAWFHETTELKKLKNGISIATQNRRFWYHDDFVEGSFIFRVPVGASLNVHNNGGGLGRVHIPLSKLDIHSNGSMTLKCEGVDDVEILVNGSGQITIEEVRKTCDLQINGSGRIRIHAGQFPHLKAVINGSGSINAYVSVQTAELVERGSGKITVGEVVDKVRMSMNRHGSIHVLKQRVV